MTRGDASSERILLPLQYTYMGKAQGLGPGTASRRAQKSCPRADASPHPAESSKLNDASLDLAETRVSCKNRFRMSYPDPSGEPTSETVDQVAVADMRARSQPPTDRFMRTPSIFFAACFLAVLLASAPARSAGYGAVNDGGMSIPAVPLDQLERKFRRQAVRYKSDDRPGTIVVDPGNHFLYLIEGKGRATRYGVSTGKGAFAWTGRAIVGKVARWPRWTPPREMVERSPNLATYQHGLEGSMFNPLGARAIYLFQDRKDTLYRIHGTSEWWSIGDDASSGCIRMLNQDVIDLASRIDNGTTVVVLPGRAPAARWR